MLTKRMTRVESEQGRTSHSTCRLDISLRSQTLHRSSGHALESCWLESKPVNNRPLTRVRNQLLQHHNAAFSLRVYFLDDSQNEQQLFSQITLAGWSLLFRYTEFTVR
jgi:hypothetical protein